MGSKMVQMGVRIPQEDAAFIAELKIEGANTPSDKLRAIIAQARQYEISTHDYQAGLATIGRLLNPLQNQVREVEFHEDIHSELTTTTLDWLSEVLAFCMASADGLLSSNRREALEEFEKHLVDRIFRLTESMLKMGITPEESCYSPNVILDKIKSTLYLAGIITQHQLTNEERK
jgi:hypothetical protein